MAAGATPRTTRSAATSPMPRSCRSSRVCGRSWRSRSSAGRCWRPVTDLRCPTCLLLRRVCLCADLPRVVTRTRVVIVRHHLERFRSSNSGRLAHLALPNSEIVEHGGVGGVAVLPPLTGAWLMFPEGAPATAAPVPPPRQLIVLDATWSQARRMYRKLAALRGLPILRLPDAPMPAARLRESPAPGRV